MDEYYGSEPYDFESTYTEIRGDFPGLYFYHKDKLLKKYDISELIVGKLLEGEYEYTTDGVFWIEDSFIDYANSLYYLRTKDDIYMVFDMTGGEMIYRSKTPIFGADNFQPGDPVVIAGKYSSYIVAGEESFLSVPLSVRAVPHTVSQVSGDYVLLGAGNGINSWVLKSDLIYNRTADNYVSTQRKDKVSQ
ncbi:MAG: hypothetical protein ACK5LX_03630 [Oscillospiraceae bacterium]